MADGPQSDDVDPLETREWLESIDSVLKVHGPDRAHSSITHVEQAAGFRSRQTPLTSTRFTFRARSRIRAIALSSDALNR